MLNPELCNEIDYFFRCYHELNRSQFNSQDIGKIKWKEEMLEKTLVITLEESEELRTPTMREVIEILKRFFVESISGKEGWGRIKQVYLGEWADAKMELFYMRCLWIYHNYINEFSAKLLAEIFIEVKYCCDFLDNRIEKDIFFNIREIAEECLAIVKETDLKPAHIKEEVDKAIAQYSQILKPTTEYAYDYGLRLVCDDYVELFCNVVGGNVQYEIA